MMRKCSKCNKLLSIDKFYKRNDRLYHRSCKSCQLESKKKYYLINAESIKKKRQRYYIENKEDIRLKESEYRKNRRKIDIKFRLLLNIRNHIYQFLKYKRNNSTIQYLGCSLENLKTHLETRFLKGMNWSNYGKEWHIDHIYPLSKINPEDKSELLQYLNYKNLQPMWAVDNIKKGNKIF